MRTLIRSSQLHPEISGLIKTYSDPNYPNYSNIFGVSGINTIASGNVLFITPGTAGSYVTNVNGLTGNINFTGVSGVRAFSSGNNIVIGLTGALSVTTLNTLNGNITLVPKGLVDIWPLNSNQIAISGIQITGEGNVYSYYSGGLLRLRSTSVGAINDKSGSLNILGIGGINVINTGQNIFIDGSFAAGSGLHSINGIGGVPLTLIAGTDIEIINQGFARSIFINYAGRGWGADNYFYDSGQNINWIGRFNIFDANTGMFVHGQSNVLENNQKCATLNTYNNRLRYSQNSTYINTYNSLFFENSGSTVINGTFSSGLFKHPYSFAVGTSSPNTFSASVHLKAVTSGKEIVKALKVPQSDYSGIFVPTGTVLVGHMDYVAARYDITAFSASFDVGEYGIYGRKYFVIQRGTNLQTYVRDQSDLFGGNDKYTIILSGGNECFYVLGSGYSGQSAEDGLDRVHDMIYMANLSFTNFNLSPNV